MPQRGRPFDPEDPEGESTFQTSIDPKLLGEPDLSGGVQLADREGVFAHSFRCDRCTLHFVLFSWAQARHTADTVTCPECGNRGSFLHRITQLSTSRSFRLDAIREPEIYDVWPFRLPPSAGSQGSLN
jgi:predicted RNA-binding Zn-ribbon protein involved in translation (DUF1610 family)